MILIGQADDVLAKCFGSPNSIVLIVLRCRGSDVVLRNLLEIGATVGLLD
jgi:hypothetical protein